MQNKENTANSQPVSAPDKKKYKGSISLRVPKTLHQVLIEEADDEGVSLNQLLLTKISVSLYDITKNVK
jgi:predicted HicB family RNase H-like nuclease